MTVGTQLAEAHFWAQIAEGQPDECWPWTGGRHGQGYGLASLGRRGHRARAHRIAYTLAVGPIPEGLCVLHRCDNPPCCNPAHLFLGTKADNSADMAAKRRGRPGNRRLREADVVAIRARAAAGEIQAALAREYGVSNATVCRVVGRKVYA